MTCFVSIEMGSDTPICDRELPYVEHGTTALGMVVGETKVAGALTRALRIFLRLLGHSHSRSDKDPYHTKMADMSNFENQWVLRKILDRHPETHKIFDRFYNCTARAKRQSRMRPRLRRNLVLKSNLVPRRRDGARRLERNGEGGLEGRETEPGETVNRAGAKKICRELRKRKSERRKQRRMKECRKRPGRRRLPSPESANKVLSPLPPPGIGGR